MVRTPRKNNNPAPRDREEVRLPRRAGTDTKVAFQRNRLKSTHTLAKYRTGYRAAWRVPGCRRYMKAIGLLKPGSYNPNNQQGGAMFSLPSEVKITDKQAYKIMYKCMEARVLTVSTLKDIRKMLSYAYQLTQNKEGNYPMVDWAWKGLNPDEQKRPTQHPKPTVTPEPKGLKKAFTTEYTKDTNMDFMEWNVDQLLTHDLSVCGLRQTVGINKIRDSESHIYAPSQGWMATELLGGRAKLEKNKGDRPWKLYRTCFCPGGKHQPMPKDWDMKLDVKGNPKEPPTWCTCCPLNAYQAVRGFLPNGDFRTYPRWLPSGKFHKTDNIGEDVRRQHFQRWLDVQGANPDGLKYDSNSGRKSLGKWCDAFNVSYEDSFEIHGDHWSTWKKHYQPRLRCEPEFNRRTQSPNPDDCTRALRRFARGIGRGRTTREDPEVLNSKQRDQLQMALMRKLGMSAEVSRILDEHKT